MFRDPALQRHFDHHGFVEIDLLDEGEVRALREAWRSLDGGLHRLPYSITPMSPDAAYRRRVHEVTVAALAGPVSRHIEGYRPHVGLFVNKARGGLDSVVSLHQDWSLVDESIAPSIGVWCPLVDVDLMNGCLFLAPGSHRLHDRPRAADGAHDPVDHAALMPILGGFVRPRALRAGRALFFTHRLFHGSGPNVRDEERPVAVMSLVPEGSRPRLYVEDFEDGREELCVYDATLDLMLSYRKGGSIHDLGGRLLGRVPFEPAPLAEDRVRSILAGAAVD